MNLFAQHLPVMEMRIFFLALMENIAFGSISYVMVMPNVKMNQGLFNQVSIIIVLGKLLFDLVG